MKILRSRVKKRINQSRKPSKKRERKERRMGW
jgi:hypothetical protein